MSNTTKRIIAFLVACGGLTLPACQSEQRVEATRLNPGDFLAGPAERGSGDDHITNSEEDTSKSPQPALSDADPPAPTGSILPPVASEGPAETSSTYTLSAMVGQVNGRPIYARQILQDVEPQLERLAADLPRARFREEAAQLIGTRLRAVVEEALVVGQAERGLTSNERQALQIAIARHRDELIRKFGRGAEKDAKVNMLEQTGLTLEDNLREYRTIVLVSKYRREELLSRIHISRRDIERYYRDNFDEYNRPAGRYINLLRVRDEASARQVAARLAQGETFEVVAGDETLNIFKPSAAGDWGEPVGRETGMGEAVDAALAELEVGQASDRIDLGERGYVWVYLRDVGEGKQESLDDVQLEIKSTLQRNRFRTLSYEHSAKLMAEGNFTPLDEMGDALMEVVMSRYARTNS